MYNKILAKLIFKIKVDIEVQLCLNLLYIFILYSKVFFNILILNDIIVT